MLSFLSQFDSDMCLYVGEEMIEHNCTKLNKSQTDHHICDSRDGTTTTLIGYCIHNGEV